MALNRDDQDVKDLIEEVTSSLAAKNKELLSELKAAKAKSKGVEIDPEEHSKLQDMVDELTAKLKTTESKSKIELDKLSKIASEKDSSLSKYLIEAGISEAIAKAGVASHYVNAVKAMFTGQAKLTNDGTGNYSATIGEKSIAETISAWAGGDEGKYFVSASNNIGGGAAGGSKPVSGPKKLSEMTSEEATALYRADPNAYSAAKNAG